MERHVSAEKLSVQNQLLDSFNLDCKYKQIY